MRVDDVDRGGCTSGGHKVMSVSKVGDVVTMLGVYCNYCSVQLSFPEGSPFIQCPSCMNIMDPNLPQQSSCAGCPALLSHPPSSLFIQCPKCKTVMNTREGTPHASAAEPHPTYIDAEAQLAVDKKKRKRRDPNAPKCPPNAYMLFCKEKRANMMQQFPSLSFGKIGAKLGHEWRALNAEEKQKYVSAALSLRNEYNKKLDEYRKMVFGEDQAQLPDQEAVK